jgi:hypothetical protein
MMMVSSRVSIFGVGILAAALTACGASGAWAQGNPNPGVAPPHSTPHGMSYPQRAEKWWQWGLSIPADENPFLDPDGRFCNVDQSGSVFFLAGNFGGSVVSTCSVPAGKALFMTDGTVLGVLGFDAATEADLRAVVEQIFADETNAHADIDGVPLQDLESYVVESPLFSFTIPENGVGLPPGEYQGILKGIFFMLEPLPAGEHVIHHHYEFPASRKPLMSPRSSPSARIAEGFNRPSMDAATGLPCDRRIARFNTAFPGFGLLPGSAPNYRRPDKEQVP